MDNNLKSALDIQKNLQKFLYIRGYLITDYKNIIKNEYPFYNNWNEIEIGNYYGYIHKQQQYYKIHNKNFILLLVGHAYNPFDMNYSEDIILKKLINKLDNSYDEFIDYFNELTGIFTLFIFNNDGAISVFTDCSGMQACYYGNVRENLYISSHTQLIGDLCSLHFDNYIEELINYKHFGLYGMYLPGDLSPFKNIKRIVPNTCIKYSNNSFSIERFYPNKKIDYVSPNEYDNVIKEISKLMSNNMELISQKWDKPAISLTGGTDSKTTLACAAKNYDKFSYFSYISMPGEKIDADAAHKICDTLNLQHKIYEVSTNKDNYNDFELVKKILRNNLGNIGDSNENDICKRIFFSEREDFDVEVKSWVSEIARANYYKKFGKKKFPKDVKPRFLTAMYKIFLKNNKLLKATDKVFEEYLEKTKFVENLYNYDWTDLFLWEIRYGSWGGLVITSEHKYSFDITIPYNNRKIMDLFLSLPLKKRIEDTPHMDIIKTMNDDINKTGIHIVNYNETKTRMYVEKMYYYFTTKLSP